MPEPLPQLMTTTIVKSKRIKPQTAESNQPLQTELQQKLAIALDAAEIFGIKMTSGQYTKEQVAKSFRISGNSYRLIVRDFKENKHMMYFEHAAFTTVLKA
jgi:hypothetical protein